MKTLFHVDPWLITETELHREDRAAADAATAAGNGFLGADGGFEEKYSGDGSRRARLAGVWVPRAREDGERRGCSAFYGCASCAPETETSRAKEFPRSAASAAAMDASSAISKFNVTEGNATALRSRIRGSVNCSVFSIYVGMTWVPFGYY